MNKIRIILVLLIAIFSFNINFAITEELVSENYLVYQDDHDIPSVVTIPPQDKVELDAELGEWSNKFTIILHPNSNVKFSDIVAEQRNIKCLSIPNEGPHLDFYDWKTQTANWKDMKKVSYNKWTSASFGMEDFSVLPDFSLNDLEFEVKKQKFLSEDPESLSIWLSQAKNCYQEKTNCYVECGTEIRFLDKSKAKGTLLKTIYIKIPMGC